MLTHGFELNSCISLVYTHSLVYKHIITYLLARNLCNPATIVFDPTNIGER